MIDRFDPNENLKYDHGGRVDMLDIILLDVAHVVVEDASRSINASSWPCAARADTAHCRHTRCRLSASSADPTRR